MSTQHAGRFRGLTPRFKLWIAQGDTESIFGGGKWCLLQAIDSTGSLKAATETLGISYRKAWGDLKKAEKSLGIQFVEKHRGGSDGGETRLTPTGKKWLAEYDRFHAAVEKNVKKEFDTWTRRISKE